MRTPHLALPAFLFGSILAVRATVAQLPQAFPNGDLNRDGTADLSDVVYLLQALFLGGPQPTPPMVVPESDYLTVKADVDSCHAALEAANLTAQAALLACQRDVQAIKAQLADMSGQRDTAVADLADMTAQRDRALAQVADLRNGTVIIDAFDLWGPSDCGTDGKLTKDGVVSASAVYTADCAAILPPEYGIESAFIIGFRPKGYSFTAKIHFDSNDAANKYVNASAYVEFVGGNSCIYRGEVFTTNPETNDFVKTYPVNPSDHYAFQFWAIACCAIGASASVQIEFLGGVELDCGTCEPNGL